MLHLKVSSPRIVMFQSLKAMRGVIKYAVIFIVLGVIGTLGYSKVRSHFVENEEFLLKELVLTDFDGEPLKHVSHTRALAIGQIDSQGTIFAVDLDEVTERLLERPEIVRVKVERRLPGTLRIQLEERDPVAWIASPQLGTAGRNPMGGLLVDARGVIFPCEGDLWQIARQLPVIEVSDGVAEQFKEGEAMVHPEALRGLHLVKLTQELVENHADWRMDRIVVENFYTLKVSCSDEVEAFFGMYEHERQLKDFIAARAHAQNKGKELAWINLLPRHNIPGQYKGEVAEQQDGQNVSAVNRTR